MVTAGMVHSLLEHVSAPVRVSHARARCKPCATCKDAHPFIKTSQLHSVLQSICAIAQGRTLIGAREHCEKSGSVLLNSRAESRAHPSGVSSVWSVAVQQYTVNFRSGRGAPLVRSPFVRFWTASE